MRTISLHRRFSSLQVVRRPALLLCTLFAVLVLSACGGRGITGLVTPYKIDIVQGNVVTREQAQLLKAGMARTEVRDVLGSPLLSSVFHADRWDYVFTFKRQGQESQQRKVTLFFKADVLERFEADELPSETEFVASLDTRRKFGKVPPLQATEEQLKTFQEKNAGAPTAPVPPTVEPGTSYPPLERQR
ncbi:outer membrane protein assembly factor BamE [Hydrogenophaga sp.]|uniref:outer membrane protein assembly factor BamE n=1 Tax=Hydrogenophaga sp. TaxID=1904254 RepID=UPI00271C9EA3|nr:outer membrane protein assembly factor BamE [Hydrogenophaga sp.]MDO9435410.1 outer membrane protein assembly factor BamE [Hydrogenophaga sp.]